jgi:hypothetical protein
VTLKVKLKSRSGGWYLSEVTTGQLEIEALKPLTSDNTKLNSALFTMELLLCQDEKTGGRVNRISFNFIVVIIKWDRSAVGVC